MKKKSEITCTKINCIHTKYFVRIQYVLYTLKYAKTFYTVNKWIKINLLRETPQP